MAAAKKAAAKPAVAKVEEGDDQAKRLVVAAPIVSVFTKRGEVQNLYEGDVISDDVSEESVENLRSLGFVSDES